MSWHDDLTDEIEEMFAPLTVCVDTISTAWSVDTGPSKTTPEAAARREANRKARMEADPEYAARRKEQLRRASKRAEAKRKAARKAARKGATAR